MAALEEEFYHSLPRFAARMPNASVFWPLALNSPRGGRCNPMSDVAPIGGRQFSREGGS